MGHMTGDELRAALKRLGWTQTRFAAVLSEAAPDGPPVAVTTVWRWCEGERAVPAAVAWGIGLALQQHEVEGGEHDDPG